MSLGACCVSGAIVRPSSASQSVSQLTFTSHHSTREPPLDPSSRLAASPPVSAASTLSPAWASAHAVAQLTRPTRQTSPSRPETSTRRPRSCSAPTSSASSSPTPRYAIPYLPAASRVRGCRRCLAPPKRDAPARTDLLLTFCSSPQLLADSFAANGFATYIPDRASFSGVPYLARRLEEC